MHFPVVKRYAQAAWGKFGFQDAMLDAKGFYFFRFNDKGGSILPIEAGPLMVKGVPLFVYQWDLSKGS